MTQEIDEAAVRHVAHLARLDLSDDDVARMAGELSAVLSYIEQMGELDVSNVEPTAHPLPVQNVLRDDVVRESLTPESALGVAPSAQDGFFKVPKVLDQETP